MLFALCSQIALLLLFAIVLVFLRLAATAVVCALTRIKLDKIAIFYGKPVFTFQTPLCPLHVGSITTGAYVSCDTADFPTHPLYARWLMVATGPIAVALSAAACLGVHETVAQMSTALSQLSQGALHPITRGAHFVLRFLDLARHAPVTGYGVFAAKCATLNVLPIPGMPLGDMLIQLFPKRGNTHLMAALRTIGAVLLLPCYISWGIAVATYFWQLR
jgi:hypothetical protein